MQDTGGDFWRAQLYIIFQGCIYAHRSKSQVTSTRSSRWTPRWRQRGCRIVAKGSTARRTTGSSRLAGGLRSPKPTSPNARPVYHNKFSKLLLVFIYKSIHHRFLACCFYVVFALDLFQQLNRRPTMLEFHLLKTWYTDTIELLLYILELLYNIANPLFIGRWRQWMQPSSFAGRCTRRGRRRRAARTSSSRSGSGSTSSMAASCSDSWSTPQTRRSRRLVVWRPRRSRKAGGPDNKIRIKVFHVCLNLISYIACLPQFYLAFNLKFQLSVIFECICFILFRMLPFSRLEIQLYNVVKFVFLCTSWNMFAYKLCAFCAGDPKTAQPASDETSSTSSSSSSSSDDSASEAAVEDAHSSDTDVDLIEKDSGQCLLQHII